MLFSHIILTPALAILYSATFVLSSPIETLTETADTNLTSTFDLFPDAHKPKIKCTKTKSLDKRCKNEDGSNTCYCEVENSHKTYTCSLSALTTQGGECATCSCA